MPTAVLLVVLTLGVLIMRKSSGQPDLKHFSPGEFGPWWPVMSRDLLLRLDAFREAWGAPVHISPATGALGREIRDEEPSSASQHNLLKWGEVRAADIMPEGMTTADQRRRAVEIARSVGFTGIGVYPHWEPSPGLHLDVRDVQQPGRRAEWSGLKMAGGQEYFGIEAGLA